MPDFRRSNGHTLAYDRLPGASPGVIFLHGLNSDRGGTKAVALEDHCRRTGRAFLRFDMYGHGASSGKFEEGGIGRWTEDALAAIDELSDGPQVLVGSSMGGWVMLRCAMARPDRCAGLIGIAAAPDFADDMEAGLSPDQHRRMMAQGYVDVPSQYGEKDYRISRHLIEDGRRHSVLTKPLPLRAPLRLLHGQKDPDVPWQTALKIAARVDSADVRVHLIKDGDHRLSRSQDLKFLCQVLESLVSP